jgi:CDP-glucose 4,6-dehydratase
VRSGNVIGGGDWAKDRLIPDCVRALAANQAIVIRNPHATRPWQHVLDPLFGYLLLGQRLLEDPERYAGAWNFGPTAIEQITVGELAERFIEAWGSGEIDTRHVDLSAPHEASMLRLSIDKAVYALNWRTVLKSSKAITWTVLWYRTWSRGEQDLRRESLKNIYEYIRLVKQKYHMV